MKVTISISDNKSTRKLNLADFNRKALVIFNEEILPQIAKAKISDTASKSVKCNNPI
jgi:hypothetical protein